MDPDAIRKLPLTVRGHAALPAPVPGQRFVHHPDQRTAEDQPPPHVPVQPDLATDLPHPPSFLPGAAADGAAHEYEVAQENLPALVFGRKGPVIADQPAYDFTFSLHPCVGSEDVQVRAQPQGLPHTRQPVSHPGVVSVEDHDVLAGGDTYPGVAS